MCDKLIHMYVCVTFLPHRAPDGDDEDADDGENQKCQDTTNHGIWNCAVSLHHCTRICGNKTTNCGVHRGCVGRWRGNNYLPKL